MNKLEKLGVYNDLSPCNPDRVVFNYSSVDLSTKLKTLLAFGLDFKLPVYKINYYDYFTCFESLVNRVKVLGCPENKLGDFIHQLHFLAYKYYYNFKPHTVLSSIFSRNDLFLLKTLSSNKNIVVTKPDKGKGVVLLNNETYLFSMNNIISDRTKFEQISLPLVKYTQIMEDKVNNFLHKVQNV